MQVVVLDKIDIDNDPGKEEQKELTDFVRGEEGVMSK